MPRILSRFVIFSFVNNVWSWKLKFNPRITNCESLIRTLGYISKVCGRDEVPHEVLKDIAEANKNIYSPLKNRKTQPQVNFPGSCVIRVYFLI